MISEAFVETDITPIPSEQPEQRFILARLEQLTFVFPSTVVAEILIVERSQILVVPFYDPAVLGVIHHGGQIVPLISIHQIMGIPAGLTRESLTVVRLSDAAGELVGLGLVVDMTLGICSSDQLPPDLFSADRLLDSTSVDTEMRVFQSELLSNYLWQPQRWQPI